MQLHPEQWARTSDGPPDCINPLGPEHCNQASCSREEGTCLRTGQLCWSLQVPWWLYCSIPDIWLMPHHWQWHILMTSKIPLLREWLPQLYTYYSFGTSGLRSFSNEDILSHDYHLHQDLRATTRDYWLWNFLQKGGIEPKPAPSPPPPPSAGQKWQCSASKDDLFDSDS
jgi:hypothetical protein